MVYNSSSCIEFIFYNDFNMISVYSTIVLTSHYLKNIFIISHLAKSTFCIPFPIAILVNCGIIAELMLKIRRKLFGVLIWKIFLENLSVDRKFDLLNEMLLNISRNYTSNKKIEFNLGKLPWMNENMKKMLKT